MQTLIDAWPVIAAAIGCIVFLFVIHFATLAAERRKRRSSDDPAFFIASFTESQARAASVLPVQGSVDVSHLISIDWEMPPVPDSLDHDPAYTEGFDWPVDISFIRPSRMSELEILEKFSRFRGALDEQPMNRGWDSANGHWTSCGTGRSDPLVFDRIVAYCSLYDSFINLPVPTVNDLNRQLLIMKTAAAEIGEMRIEPRFSADEAIKKLGQIRANLEAATKDSYYVILTLAAPDGTLFDGRDVWDVMMCLGLQWGDMDLFHLPNTQREGRDSLFSVWTSTPPGYFLPEPIAAGKFNTVDLVFGFQLAEVPRPDLVFDAMARAIDYARGRLGGILLDDNRKPADLERMRNEIISEVDRLTGLGFSPGSNALLRVLD